jgi:hypothetical protein
MEQVQSNVTFLLPSLAIDTTYPPTTRSEAVPYISLNEYNFFNAENGLDGEEFQPPDLTVKPDEAYDQFFLGVFHGRDEKLISRDKLLGPNNTDALYINIQNFYRRYMAQVINANYRISGTDPLAPSYKSSNWSSINAPLTFKATITVPETKIFQNNISKIVLQVVLGLMLVCSVAGWVLMGKGEVLTHDPNSIAGLGSWIAGGKLVDMQELGLEQDWIIRKDFMAGRVFEGKTYSLGWWPLGSGSTNGRATKQDAQAKEGEHAGERFGIDIGQARW